MRPNTASSRTVPTAPGAARLGPIARARLLVFLPLFVAAGSALSQTFPLDVEAGYRYLDLTGSEQMYRSQVNERNGFFLRSLTLTGVDMDSSFADNLRLDAADLGAAPHGTLRLDVGKSDAWRLRINWRRNEMYSALPGWANPLVANGIVPGQHTTDRTRNILDAEIEVLPWKEWITPIIGYTLNQYSGPGTTTATVGGDDFKLTNDLTAREQEFRIGASFNAGPLWGLVTQGWRQYEETEEMALAPGAGAGNSSGTLLGVPITASSISRTRDYDADTPVTNAFVGVRLGFFKLTGNYVRASADGDATERESLAGDFVSFQINQSFKALEGNTISRTESTYWRGGARAEVNLFKGLDLYAGWTSRHRDLDGFALISELYQNTAPLSAVQAGDLETVLEARTAMEREEEIFDVGATWRDVGPFSFHLEWQQNDQDVTVTADPSEIVLPGGQGGAFEREIESLSGGASVHFANVLVSIDFRNDDADKAVVRTDYLDKKTIKVRASWKPLDLFRIGGTYLTVDTRNADTGFDYDGYLEQYALDVEVTPFKWVTARFTTAQTKNETSIPIRIPQSFAIEPSRYAENGIYYEGGLKLKFGEVLLDGTFSSMDNEGSSPFKMDRVRTRLEVPLPFASGLAAGMEYANDEYREGTSGLGNYDASRYGFFIRFHQ